MGSNLALNIAEKGNRIAVFNRTPSRTDAFVESAGELKDRIVPCHTIAELAAAIRPPRPIIILVQAGKPVDEQIALLRRCSPGTTSSSMPAMPISATRCGASASSATAASPSSAWAISGGEEGARHGPSIMVGGTRESYARVESILTAIAAKFEGEPCCAWLGEGGAGHFVKTIHNGIEYADMQMIAEIYGVLRDGLGMQPKAIGEVFGDWNKGRLNSYLIEITAEVLAADDPRTGKPVVDIILDRAGQKGTGRWSVIEAQTLGVPATAIEAAVAARILSAMKGERVAAEKVYGAPAASRSKAVSTGCAPISSWRCLPARSPPMRKASRSWTWRRRNSAGACRSPPSPRSGAPAASSVRSSSAPSPRPSARARPCPTC